MAQELRAAFAFFDKDGDGQIGCNDLKQALTDRGLTTAADLSEDVLGAMLGKLGAASTDQVMDYAAFVAMMSA